MTVPTGTERRARYIDGLWYLPVEDFHELRERMLAVLKEIAESPESRDALQVRAWQVYDRESPERWGLVVEEPGVGSQAVPDFSKGKS